MPSAAVPRIAWFTPLRPVESGISHYNEELLPILATAWQLDVFVDGIRPTHLAPTDQLRILPAGTFRARQRRDPYDAIVYQMGNSPAHAYMYRLALEHPGVLVLHDTLLHHLRLSMLLKRRGAREYQAVMRRRYGEAGEAAATRVLRGQIPEALFDFPLSEEVIEASRLIVVHSQFSREQVLGWSPDAEVVRVPMGVPLPPEVATERARDHLALPQGQFILSSVTHVNPYKRLDVVLRVLRRLRESLPARMVIAGSISPLVPLERLVSLLGVEQAVDLLGFVDDPTARLVVAAADVCVNLRYPTAGETSASLLRTLGAGRPVLVTDAGSFQEIPDGVVVKVPPDALEEETVYALMRRLAEDADLRRAIGTNARCFIAREHSLSAMAAGYRAALEKLLGGSLPAPRVASDLESLVLPDLRRPGREDPLVSEVADALSELGLGGDSGLVTETARAMSEIGLTERVASTDAGAGKIVPTNDAGNDSGGSPDERASTEAHQR